MESITAARNISGLEPMSVLHGIAPLCVPMSVSGDFVDEQYFIDKIDYLEIGSAGLERSVRRLAQLEQSIGKKVRVKTYKLCDGAPSKDFKCVLSGYDGEKITLTGDFGEISLPAADISAMNYDDFDDHELIEDGE